MQTVKTTIDGRITIPAQIRKKYGLTHGRKVKLEETNKGMLITPLVTKEEIITNIGFLGTKGKLINALMEEKRGEREL